MLVGLVGKPNVGKSSTFQAMTLAHAEVANYPFTTIDANVGVGHVRVPDPSTELGVDATPRTGFVRKGTRFVPVQIVDVAGLVPGAHEGKGMGNKFLSDLARADALLHVVDATGATDAEGNPGNPGDHDPLEDVAFLPYEIEAWMDGLLSDNWERVMRKAQQEGRKIEVILEERLNGLGITLPQIVTALRDSQMAGKKPIDWTDDARKRFIRELRRIAKPIIVLLNKADLVAGERLQELLDAIPDAMATSAQSELALRKGAEAGALSYVPGDTTFEILADLNDAQKQGLQAIQDKVLNKLNGTGVQKALETAVFEVLQRIPAFPVADESKWTDKEGRVLPDCFLISPGTQAQQLAYMVHTDLGDHFVRAIDGRTKRALGKDHVVEAGQVLCIKANS